MEAIRRAGARNPNEQSIPLIVAICSSFSGSLCPGVEEPVPC
jgi:hypothetical protein